MEPTHVYFDGQKIIFSENLAVIPLFLIEIDKEVESFLKREEQMKQIRCQLSEYIDLIKVMATTIKNAGLDFTFQMTEPPATIAGKLIFAPHPRSEMIVLFAYLETLRCLWTGYKKKTDNEQDLRDAGDDILESFYQEFCLSKENKWVKENSKIAGKISKEKLQRLRNSLTHFFSVSELGIAPRNMKDVTEKMMNDTNNRVVSLSSDDLKAMISGAATLMIKRWSDDFQDSLNDSDSEFEIKIKCVQNIVEKYGAVIVKQNKNT